ncbi:NUDIX domain-containing protein [Patescibacteria group bacterium]|nr:NUDIX domain-containing protein [Patescibacteria group bacterium]
MKQKFPEPIVGGLILNKKGELLLVKSPKWLDRYSVPGGHIEVGEDFATALRREVKEEVGLDIEVKDLLYFEEVIYTKEYWKPKHFIFFDFYCTVNNNAEVKIDGQEIIGYMWVKPEEALRLRTDSFTKRAIKEYLSLIRK